MNEKQKIERVLDAFRNYLHDNPTPEVFWSAKQQCYIYFRWYQGIDEYYEKIVESAEEMCEDLLQEIYLDVYLEHKLHQRASMTWEMNAAAKKETLQRMQQYMEQLPEYQYLVEKTFKSNGNN